MNGWLTLAYAVVVLACLLVVHATWQMLRLRRVARQRNGRATYRNAFYSLEVMWLADAAPRRRSPVGRVLADAAATLVERWAVAAVIGALVIFGALAALAMPYPPNSPGSGYPGDLPRNGHPGDHPSLAPKNPSGGRGHMGDHGGHRGDFSALQAPAATRAESRAPSRRPGGSGRPPARSFDRTRPGQPPPR